MSYNFNAGAGLPFSHNAPMSQPYNFRLDNPPITPPNLSVDPRLNYLIPPICSMVANEAASKCNLHAGRMFLFNQLAANNYNNPDYIMAVSTALDILQLNLFKGVTRNPEDGLAGAVGDSLLLLCSLNFQTFPALQSVTPPDIVNDALNNINILISLGNEINLMKQRNQAPQQSWQQPQQQSTYQPQQQQYRNPQPTEQYDRYGPSKQSNSGLFTGGSMPNIQTGSQIKQNNVTNDKYAYLNKQQETQALPEALKVFYNNTDNTSWKVEPIAEVEELVWAPSDIQPYPNTVDPTTQKLLLKKVQNNGSLVVVTYIVPLKEEEMAMERNQHKLTSLEQIYTNTTPKEANTRREALQDRVRELGRIVGSDIAFCQKPDNVLEETFAAELKTHLRPSWEIDSFLESAIFEGRLYQKIVNDENIECTAYRTYSTIATPIICNKDYADVIKKLSTSILFRDLSNAMTEYSVFETNDLGLIHLLDCIDKLLTKEVTHILRNRLSLPVLTIDSFTDDVTALPDYLGGKFGDIYKRAFIAVQKEIIPSLLNTIDVDAAKAMSENFKDGEEDITLNFLSQNYSITYLNVHSRELAFQPFELCASAILESGTPLLHRIARSIYDQEKDLDQKVLHRLIITSDDKRYEISKGLIGSDIYTVCQFQL